MTQATEHESTGAWRELLATLGALERSFLGGDRAVAADRHVADGYRMIATTLGVAFDSYLFPEPGRPAFVAVNTPFRRDRRWGGDNTTAYNEPSPGAWSDRIVTIVRDDDLDIDAVGDFSFELGPTPDAAMLMTRDYQADPLTGRPVSWRVEALDEPEPIRHGDAETAARLRASAAWLRTMFAIVPLAVGARVDDAHALGHEIAHAANQFADPQRGAQRGRLGDGRPVQQRDGAPEFPDHAWLSAWQPGLSLVPCRRGPGAAGRSADEVVRCADECRCSAALNQSVAGVKWRESLAAATIDLAPPLQLKLTAACRISAPTSMREIL